MASVLSPHVCHPPAVAAVNVPSGRVGLPVVVFQPQQVVVASVLSPHVWR